MTRLALSVLVILVAVTLSVAVHRPNKHGNKIKDIAKWALGEIGPGYDLIRVKKVKQEHADGTLYRLKLKVRFYRLGGFSEKMTCIVKVLDYENYRILTYQRCYNKKGGRDMGSPLI